MNESNEKATVSYDSDETYNFVYFLVKNVINGNI